MRFHVLAMHMHTEALAGHGVGESCRRMSTAAGASGDRVLASTYIHTRPIAAPRPLRVIGNNRWAERIMFLLAYSYLGEIPAQSDSRTPTR